MIPSVFDIKCERTPWFCFHSAKVANLTMAFRDLLGLPKLSSVRLPYMTTSTPTMCLWLWLLQAPVSCLASSQALLCPAHLCLPL